MKTIKTKEAVGHVLCHDITQIVRGGIKDAVFRKGHIVTETDIPILLSMGKENLYIWEINDNLIHENDAADILCKICQGANMHPTPPREGKIDLIADMDGLLIVDIDRLRAINSVGEMIIATRTSGFPVKEGEKLCGTRIIPLLIEKEKMDNASRIAGEAPLLNLLPFRKKKYGLIATGNEIYHGLIQDTFSRVIQEKLKEYDCEMAEHRILDDNPERITAAINEMLSNGVQMVFCTGGMSVDPDDTTPIAIKNQGASIISHGAPVLPGAMFLIAYTADMRPICGLPGCVMHAGRSIFDLVLPLLLADVPVTPQWLAGLGNGGICLNCSDCRFPNCMFGKGT